MPYVTCRRLTAETSRYRPRMLTGGLLPSHLFPCSCVLETRRRIILKRFRAALVDNQQCGFSSWNLQCVRSGPRQGSAMLMTFKLLKLYPVLVLNLLLHAETTVTVSCRSSDLQRIRLYFGTVRGLKKNLNAPRPSVIVLRKYFFVVPRHLYRRFDWLDSKTFGRSRFSPVERFLGPREGISAARTLRKTSIVNLPC